MKAQLRLFDTNKWRGFVVEEDGQYTKKF